MKKLILFSALLCLLSLSAFAQGKTTDFSGEWTLDKAKSTLPDRMKNIESMTLTVTQTDKEIKVASATKRGAPMGGPGAGGPPPQGGGGGGDRPMGGGGRGGMGGGMGGDQTLTYALDGKETSSEAAGPGGNPSTVKLIAKADGAKLNLTNSRAFTTQMGEMKITTKETWELQADGSLKVKRDTESMQGTQTAELVFTKPAAAAAPVK
jgi:hypothetical protein